MFNSIYRLVMTREEAIKELRGFIGQLTEGCQEAIKILIPELKEESEDERIRKEILEDIRNVKAISSEEYRKKADRWIAWLEKQKEQKPAEWSEEDENNIGKLHRLLVICQSEKKFIPTSEYEKLDKWLKSLRLQKRAGGNH